MAGGQVVAFKQALASSGEISQNGFITALPSRVCLPQPSSVAAPELMRCSKPCEASPCNVSPVTRFTGASRSVKSSAAILSGYTVNTETWAGFYDSNRHTTGRVSVLANFFFMSSSQAA